MRLGKKVFETQEMLSTSFKGTMTTATETESNGEPIEFYSLGTALCIYDIGGDALYTLNCLECSTTGCIAKNQPNVAGGVQVLAVVYGLVR